jgi:PAS domain S-box-containing protein
VKIKAKIFWTFLSMSLLVVLVGALAVNRQQVAARVGATKEAGDVARALGFLLSDSNGFSASAQETIRQWHQAEGRDVVLVDTNQLILADAVASDIGKVFTEDRGDEVGATLKDRQVRIFIENSSDSPQPIKQIVVPVQNHSGRVVGAVVLEYTPLYDELMESTRSTTQQVMVAGAGSVILALMITLYMSRSIAGPLQQLTKAVTGFAVGKMDLPMPPPRKDEIGELADAFQNMVQKRRQVEEELRHARDGLETRVTERVAELANTNEALRVENGERKRAEEELRWKTAFLEAQVNSSIDGILVVDEQGEKLLQNQRMTDQWNIPQTVAEDNDLEKELQWVTGIIKNPAPFLEKIAYLNSHPNEISQDEIERTDGKMFERYSSPVIGEDGKRYGRIWTFRDVTDRRRTEEIAKRLAAIVENSNEAIISKTLDGIITSWNPAAERMFGYLASEIIGQPLQMLIPPDHPHEEAEILAGFARGELARHFETVRVRKDGQRFDASVTISPIKGIHGRVVGISKIVRDITERKRTEESLRLLSSAIEQSKESVMITNAELDLPGPEIIFVNPAFTHMTGYTAAETLGKTPRMLQGPRTDKTVLRRLRHNLERGEVFHGEAINYRKDQREFNLEWQIAPIRNASGMITHFVAIQHDITEHKQLEARLLQSQKMETVGKLAGGIAHEFNSILTAIIGQSELLLGDLPAGSPLAKNVTEIHKAAGRAAVLTRQLLAYGRKQILQPEALDLNRVITSMEGVFHHLVGGNVNTQIIPALGLKAVKADAGQIEQVIMNMAMNAADAMPNGGKLMLETANVTFDPDSVGRYPELKPGDYVMLAISDTGTGMTEEVKARVFEPFFSTKGVGLGTGLGLSTCYGIIKQSGGHISVYSELGRGTTFKIYLPQVEPQLPIPNHRLDSPELPSGTETILLVEDDPALREMAATLLRRLGYTVLTAGNGVEALSVKHDRNSGHIDLLFTDVVMPHMSGKELADRMRALYPHTKILFTSAYTENAIVHQGVLDQGVALLQKPFTPTALARKVRETLDKRNT